MPIMPIVRGLSSILSALLIGFVSSTCPVLAADKPPQFVALAFDGSYNLGFWAESRQFAKDHNLKFTYFISGVYYLTSADRGLYVEPQYGPGRSSIGFGGTPSEVQRRIEQTLLASQEGHEIASHANGHFDGRTYSESQWRSEFNQFSDILGSAWSRYMNGPVPSSWSEVASSVGGFRAPVLGVGKGLWPILREKNFFYDTSRIAPANQWPTRIGGVWNFALAGLRTADTRRAVLSMDYNFYMADSGAKPGPRDQYPVYEKRMLDTYMNYFNSNYNGSRAPIHIGHHFSPWNGGAYWRAMKRFAAFACAQPDVICGTYTELTEYMKNHRPPQAAASDSRTLKVFSPSDNKGRSDEPLSATELSALEAQAHDHFGAHLE
jgi:peptidoglycan/xylan/chitin deacetylase (PgdA/CDA1 family)